jgi:hypothetical protein
MCIYLHNQQLRITFLAIKNIYVIQLGLENLNVLYYYLIKINKSAYSLANEK